MSRSALVRRIPTHPGTVLLEEFLVPLEVSQVRLAAHIGVPVQRVNQNEGEKLVRISTTLTQTQRPSDIGHRQGNR